MLMSASQNHHQVVAPQAALQGWSWMAAMPCYTATTRSTAGEAHRLLETSRIPGTHARRWQIAAFLCADLQELGAEDAQTVIVLGTSWSRPWSICISSNPSSASSRGPRYNPCTHRTAVAVARAVKYCERLTSRGKFPWRGSARTQFRGAHAPYAASKDCCKILHMLSFCLRKRLSCEVKSRRDCPMFI